MNWHARCLGLADGDIFTATPTPVLAQGERLVDLITTSLLSNFVGEYGIVNLPQDRQFEHFAAHITIRQQFKETFSTFDVAVGGGNDLGIDAIAIIVNGRLVADLDELKEATAGGSASMDVVFVFVQAERTEAFDGAKIATFGSGVAEFFTTAPKLPRKKEIVTAAAVMRAIYDRSEKFARGRPRCHLYYVTTGKWQGDQFLEARRQVAREDLINLNLFDEVTFTPVDADGVRQMYTDSKNSISRTFDFPKKAAAPDIAGVSQAFVGFVSAKTFLSLITDENGDILRSVFYDNVRDWQGETNPVNSAIADTLTTAAKRSRFLLMNNGVTIIARRLTQISDKVTIDDYQVVNGCQTSYAVFTNLGADDEDDVMVPLRVVATENEEIIAAIIEGTNRQTVVQEVQFLAVTEFSKKLEHHFSAFDAPEKRLFYERRSRQYDYLSIERARIITPSQLIRAYAAMFLGDPHGTTRSFGRLREMLGTTIFNKDHKLDPYYAAGFAHYRLEFLFRNNRILPFFKPARYHLIFAVRLLAAPGVIPRENSHEMERYCKKVTDVLWDVDKSDKLFGQAAEIVLGVATKHNAISAEEGDESGTGALDRDIVRTQPFTADVIAECAKVSDSGSASSL